MNEPELTAPTVALDVDGLHARWAEQFLPVGASCDWATFKVGDRKSGPDLQRPGIAQAIAAASADASVCGPTIHLGAGRWQEPALIIDKPTIIVGEPGAVLSLTIASARGAPLWIQDVTMEDAPYPGALFVSHPAAETTLVRVAIHGGAGYGVLHNGGYLSIYDSEISAVRAAADALADPRTEAEQLRAGFGQPRAGTTATRAYAISPRLAEVVVRARARLGFNLDEWVELATSSDQGTFAPVDLLDLGCSGVGQLMGPGFVELGNVSYSGNERAGLTMGPNAFGLATHLVVGGNGDPTATLSDSDIEGLSTGAACVGGLKVRDQSLLLVDHFSSSLNAPANVVVSASIVDIAGADILWALDSAGSWGDGVFVINGGHVSLTNAAIRNSVRVGLFYSGSGGNLFVGDSINNRFGLALLELACTEVYVSTSFDISDNTEAEQLSEVGCPLPVPNEPMAVPELP